jgi:N4-(beta-N-acetylglucosaminyl)-L-asparaginase
VCFIAVNKQGQHGAYALQKGFSYAVCDDKNQQQLLQSDYLLT